MIMAEYRMSWRNAVLQPVAYLSDYLAVGRFERKRGLSLLCSGDKHLFFHSIHSYSIYKDRPEVFPPFPSSITLHLPIRYSLLQKSPSTS